ncbi:GATA transcription factor 1 [Linum grandiflorum]
MDFLDPVDDFLDFSSDDELTSSSVKPNDLASAAFGLTDQDFPLPESLEEELEWISNKEAFPALETFVDILSEHPGSLPKQNSPVSVLENSTTSSQTNGSSGSGFIMSYCRSLQPPVKKARSKRHLKCRRDLQDPRQCWWNHQEKLKTSSRKPAASKIGRKCQHCGSEKTPQWRAGPMGPKTLCNACGVRYKSGRLVPEYRPANSPTFSMEMHSNSHRKVLEMRKKKQVMGIVVVKPFEKG